jgi:DNA-binding HxlR family transcriptional regulator
MTRKDLTAPEAEAALVGAALLDPVAFTALDVSPAHFHDAQLAIIWEAGRDLTASGGGLTPYDTTAIEAELVRRGAAIPFARLSDCLAACKTSAYAGEYARVVRDMAGRRAALGVLQRAAQAVYARDGTWGDDLTGLAEQLVQLATPRPARQPRKTSWTVTELMATEFPDPPWAVPDILPVGLSILAGRPKIGKSWLALQMAHAVATGGMVLDRKAAAGRVLFVALEDSPRRLKDRLIRQRAPSTADLRFELHWRHFPNGGLGDLYRAIEREGYTFVVIDTLPRALGRADQQDIGDMTGLVGDLQDYAQQHDVAILCIDHHRKPAGFVGDPVDDIMASTAKSAVADAALGLWKEQGKRGAVLKVIGRDLDWLELALTWDNVTCCWQLEGTVEEVALRGRKTDVLAALKAAYPEARTVSEIAASTKLDAGNLSRILADLVNDGLIDRLTRQGRRVPYTLSKLGQEVVQ